MVCPSDCCWRGPENEAEEAAFDKYYDDRRTKEMEFFSGCFVEQSELAREIMREIPPQ